MADDKVQPVPCVLALAMRRARIQVFSPLRVTSRSAT